MIQIEPRGLGAVTDVQWLPTRPECLEFACRVPTGRGLITIPALFRIPVEPTGREAAEVAFRHYRDLIAGNALVDPRSHRLAVRLAVLVAVIGLRSARWGSG